MRIACAWLLLVLTLSNWIGGFLCFEMSCYLQAHHEMNALEQSIADNVQREIGTKSTVKMLQQQARLKGDVYGDVAFAEEINGETVFYTFLDQSSQYEKVNQSTETPTSSDNHHALLLKSLLQEFEVTQPNYLLSSALTPVQTNFLYTGLTGYSFNRIFTPPPNLA